MTMLEVSPSAFAFSPFRGGVPDSAEVADMWGSKIGRMGRFRVKYLCHIRVLSCPASG